MDNNTDKIIEDITSEDKSKLEVVLKHDAKPMDGAEIDLMNIFTNMGKRKKIYVWFILACMFIGALAPSIVKKVSAADSISAIIYMQYPEAEELLAPDGTDLDVGKIMSTYIVQVALNKTHLSYDLTASDVSSNIKVERVVSDDTRKQLEILAKYNNTQYNESYINLIESVDYAYKTSYIITLNNGFLVGSKTKTLPGKELAELLNNIIDEYKTDFFVSYDKFKMPDNRMADISLDDLDYIEWLDSMDEILDDLSDYCLDTTKGDFLNYRSHKTGLTFKDINELINLAKDVQVEYLYAFVYYNSLSKDKENTLTNYRYKLLSLNRKLDIINEQIATGKVVIENYKNDNILVAGKGEGDSDEDYSMNIKRVTDNYNALIMQQADYYEDRADINLMIRNLNDKIEGFSAGSGTAYQLSIIKDESEKVLTTMQNIYDLVKNQAAEIRNSDSYLNSYVSSVNAICYSPSMFALPNLINLAKFAGIGLAVGLLIWCLDGLILELIDSNKRAKMAVKDEE